MNPEDVPDEWVEKAARAIYEAAATQAYHDPEQTLDEGDWPEWDVEDPFFSELLRDARHALAAVLPDIQAQALRDHRRRVARFMPAGMVDRATVLADLDDYAARLTASATDPT